MKKLISIAMMAIMLMFSVSYTYAENVDGELLQMEEDDFAITEDAVGPDEYGIMPYSVYIGSVSTLVQNMGSGKIGIHVGVYCCEPVNSITSNLYLQKKINGTWTNVASGTVSNTGSASLSKGVSISGMSSGTYRAKSVTQVIKNGFAESMTGYSGSITI